MLPRTPALSHQHPIDIGSSGKTTSNAANTEILYTTGAVWTSTTPTPVELWAITPASLPLDDYQLTGVDADGPVLTFIP